MEKENGISKQTKLYTAIIIFLAYIAIISFPFGVFFGGLVGKITDLSLKIGFLVFTFITIYRYELCKIQILPKKNFLLLLFIPLVLLTCSNWIYIWIFKSPLNKDFDVGSFTFDLVITLVTVICEELLFREVIQERIKDYISKEYLVILMSAGIFASIHVVNIFNGTPPLIVLAQIGYTSVLGLILSFMREKGTGFIALCLFHFLFNSLNNNLFTALYNGDWNATFIVTNIIIGTIVVLYGVGLYFLLKNKSLSSNGKNNQNNKITKSTDK